MNAFIEFVLVLGRLWPSILSCYAENVNAQHFLSLFRPTFRDRSCRQVVVYQDLESR